MIQDTDGSNNFGMHQAFDNHCQKCGHPVTEDCIRDKYCTRCGEPTVVHYQRTLFDSKHKRLRQETAIREYNIMDHHRNKEAQRSSSSVTVTYGVTIPDTIKIPDNIEVSDPLTVIANLSQISRKPSNSQPNQL